MARRPAQGLSSLVWSMSGLPATLAELEPCFAILPTSSIVGAWGQRSRALFEYTWGFGKTSDGRAGTQTQTQTHEPGWQRRWSKKKKKRNRR